MSKGFTQNKFIEELVQQVVEKLRKEAKKYLDGYTTRDELVEDVETESFYFVKNIEEIKKRRN